MFEGVCSLRFFLPCWSRAVSICWRLVSILNFTRLRRCDMRLQPNLRSAVKKTKRKASVTERAHYLVPLFSPGDFLVLNTMFVLKTILFPMLLVSSLPSCSYLASEEDDGSYHCFVKFILFNIQAVTNCVFVTRTFNFSPVPNIALTNLATAPFSSA